MSRQQQAAFTIVELLIVIVIIAILAAISIVAYRGIQQRAALSTMSSDLKNAAKAFELYKVDNDGYPTSIPSGVTTSDKIVLSATQSPPGTFCINAYHQSDTSLQASWDSRNGLRTDSICSGAAIGSSSGGSVPTAARGVTLAPSFSLWTLTGSAAYNSSTGELTLGANGSARSPLIRVDSPAGIKTGGDMHATVASSHASLTPQGGYHVSISYFGSDGTTPAQNTTGHTGNGCARAIALNTQLTAVDTCGFNGGPNVMYVTYLFQGPNGGYTSSDLKIKNPLLVVND